MQISSRFTIAVHTLVAIEYFRDDNKITSDFIAGSVQVNPVVIRRILSQLKKAGLVEIARGNGGTTLKLPAAQITLYDVYKAVECVENEKIFHFHENPNPQCPVGSNIHRVLDGELDSAQAAFEENLKRTTIADLVNKI
jgi:Rrf2 family protein